MTVAHEGLRDGHRLFGLLLKDFFSGSPFVVEVERDLSVQQPFLDGVIVRRSRGRFAGPLPDGLQELRPHNLMSFKSHHGALDAFARVLRTDPDLAVLQKESAYRALRAPLAKR